MMIPVDVVRVDDDRLDADELFNLFPKGIDLLIMKLIAPELCRDPITSSELRTVLHALKATGHRQ